MKFLNNISIRIKVILPISVLALVILLSSAFGMLNSKRLLDAGYDISDNCSKSIEYLMQMSSVIEAIENDVNSHCNSDNTITKNEYKGTIDAELEKMRGFMDTFATLPLTEEEETYFGAMKIKFNKYVESMTDVLNKSAAGDTDAALEAMNVYQKPLENYLSYKIESLIEMKGDDMARAIDTQENAYMASVTTSVIFIFISVIMIFVAIFICTKYMVRPIGYISRTLEKMVSEIENKQGDLSVRIAFDGKDEIGVMGSSINRFIETLQNILGQINHSSDQMNQIVEEVGERISFANDNSNDISAAMEELSASMENVSETVSGILDNMNEIGRHVEEIATSSDGLLTYSERMEQTANSLKGNAIKNKDNTSEMTNAIIGRLEKAIQESKEVEKVKALTNDIVNIAEQTNLLALNASIEAARAGNAGRGFAVVATEIGQLSDASRDAAENIQAINNIIVKNVYELIDNANELVGYIKERILPDYDNFVDAGVQYNDDAKYVYDVVGSFHKMSMELEERTEKIQGYIDNISNAVKDSAQGISMAAENTGNLSSDITLISSRIMENKAVADLLSQEAESFKN